MELASLLRSAPTGTAVRTCSEAGNGCNLWDWCWRPEVIQGVWIQGDPKICWCPTVDYQSWLNIYSFQRQVGSGRDPKCLSDVISTWRQNIIHPLKVTHCLYSSWWSHEQREAGHHTVTMRETLAPRVTVHKPLVKYLNPIDLFNVTTADGTSYVGGVVAWGVGGGHFHFSGSWETTQETFFGHERLQQLFANMLTVAYGRILTARSTRQQCLYSTWNTQGQIRVLYGNKEPSLRKKPGWNHSRKRTKSKVRVQLKCSNQLKVQKNSWVLNFYLVFTFYWFHLCTA